MAASSSKRAFWTSVATGSRARASRYQARALEPSQRSAGVADRAEGWWIVAPGERSGILDEPVDLVLRPGRFEVGAGGGGIAVETERLTQSKERVAVGGAGGEGRTVVTGRGPVAL